jgi:hypothetical protein
MITRALSRASDSVSWPLKEGIVTARSLHDPKGVVHVVEGNGGVPNRNSSDSSWKNSLRNCRSAVHSLHLFVVRIIIGQACLAAARYTGSAAPAAPMAGSLRAMPQCCSTIYAHGWTRKLLTVHMSYSKQSKSGIRIAEVLVATKPNSGAGTNTSRTRQGKRRTAGRLRSQLAVSDETWVGYNI